MMKELPYIPRLSELERISGLVKPWDFESKEVITDAMRETKKDRMAWANNPKTEHCFFSGFLGLNPDGRISKINENPASEMLALVVDYDGKQDMDKFLKMVDKYNCEYPPNYLSQSMGGGLHAVWILEEPINVTHTLLEGLMKEISAGLKLPKLANHLDKPALFDTSKYYTAGDTWKQVSTLPIPDAQCKFWVKEALKSQTLRLGSEASIDVPLDLAYDEAVKMYGPLMEGIEGFELGMRCRRFWDPSAKDDTGAFLMNNGFYCHSGDETFKDWRGLLGNSFIEQFKVQQFDELTKDTWYNGKDYIYKNEANGQWTLQAPKDASLRYNVDFRMSKKVPKGAESSPIDEILRDIQKHKPVVAFANFVHQKEGLLEFQGSKYLNMSQLKAIAPSGRLGKWGELFPFLAQFMDSFLSSEFEKLLVLAWWKRSYEGALNYKPERGQVLLIAGPPACGKSLFNTKMLAPSLGGGIDAADYYVNGSDFTDVYYNYGLHMVDDAEPGSRIGSQKSMAARLKKTAAASSISVNGKYKDVRQIEWLGRVCITMNNDVESLKATPEIQDSLEDKLIAVQANPPSGQLELKSDELEAVIKKELPHLLQWLIDWKPSAAITGGTRYGVKHYCNLKLREDMESGSADMNLFEMLEVFLEECRASTEWEGKTWVEFKTSVLLERMKDCDSIKHGMRTMNAMHLGHILSRGMKRGLKLKTRRMSSGAFWVIDFDLRGGSHE